MWNLFENDLVNDLYSKIELDEIEVSKCFKPLEWFAIAQSGHAKNVSRVSQWYRVPKNRKIQSVGRFQHLIYDEDGNDGTNRWRKFFKDLVKQLRIHPNRTNIIQLGFSLLAVHPLKLAKEKPNAYVYVSFLTLLFDPLGLRCTTTGSLHTSIFNSSRSLRFY